MRGSKHAQWEIREMARLILLLLKDDYNKTKKNDGGTYASPHTHRQQTETPCRP